jgi:hypothetical protein
MTLWHICLKQWLWSQQRQPLLGNGSANTPVASQHLLKNAAIPEPSLNNRPRQQWRNCWKRCFLCSPCRGHMTKTAVISSQSVSRESRVQVEGQWLERERESAGIQLSVAVAEAGDSSGTQRKGNTRRWKPLPSRAVKTMTENTSLCVIVIRKV